MSDIQKTTKAVREAPTASQSDPLDPEEKEAALAALDYHIARIEDIDDTNPRSLLVIRLNACKRAKEKIENEMSKASPETKPRHTVELTTEGWQIKDLGTGHIRADTFGSYESAAHECASLNAASAYPAGH